MENLPGSRSMINHSPIIFTDLRLKTEEQETAAQQAIDGGCGWVNGEFYRGTAMQDSMWSMGGTGGRNSVGAGGIGGVFDKHGNAIPGYVQAGDGKVKPKNLWQRIKRALRAL